MSESAPIAFPTIQSGIYRIGSPFNELYLELQRDGSLKAMALNTLSDAQKVCQTLHLQLRHPVVASQQISDPFYAFVVADQPKRRRRIRDQMCMGQLRIALRDVFCAQECTSTSSDTTLDYQSSRSFTCVHYCSPFLTIANG